MESLPNEILLQIFEELDYTALRVRVGPVCRRFRDILSARDGKMARIMFRDDVSETYKSSEKHQLHPIFYQRELTCVTSANATKFRYRPEWLSNSERARLEHTRVTIARSSIADENAVSPAVDSFILCVDGNGWAEIPIHASVKGKGVTVMDVVQFVVDSVTWKSQYAEEFWDGMMGPHRPGWPRPRPVPDAGSTKNRAWMELRHTYVKSDGTLCVWAPSYPAP